MWCVRETEILVEQQPPQGLFVCDHAGLVINKELSLQAGSAVLNAMHSDEWDGCQEQLSIGLSDTDSGVLRDQIHTLKLIAQGKLTSD